MFFEKLELEMKQRKLNLNSFAKEVGISQASTNRYKNGTLPNADALIRICKYLGVSADYLLDLEDEAPPPKLTPEEQKLLDDYRSADPRGQDIIVEIANKEAERNKPKETATLLNSVG